MKTQNHFMTFQHIFINTAEKNDEFDANANICEHFKRDDQHI